MNERTEQKGIYKKRKFFNKKKKSNKKGGFHHKKHSNSSLKVIPLGGLNQVGQNMMALEYKNDIIIIDMGFLFPDEKLPGVDYIIPDISYLKAKKDNIRGVFFTHGHLDHIGGVKFLLPQLNYPTMFGFPLTLGLIKKSFDDFPEKKKYIKTSIVKPREVIKVGGFEVTLSKINHSIPDAALIHVKSPAGDVLHTGDYRFDFNPLHQDHADYEFIASLNNVDLMCGESTNAKKPGFSVSEQVVAKTFEDIFEKAKGRLIVASFASLIGRIQQLLHLAEKHNKKVFITGRSMINNVKISKQLKHLQFKSSLIQDLKSLKKFRDDEVVIITTGSQGEPMAALSRIAHDRHAKVKLKANDTVVMSSSPIIGNEKDISVILNELARKNIKVITNKNLDVHTSGHGMQEDLKLMITLLQPKNIMPIHGEYHMRKAHGELAKSLGYEENQVHLVENGDIIEIKNGKVFKSQDKLDQKLSFVDKNQIGTTDMSIIEERKKMAESGILVIALNIHKKKLKNINIGFRGFLYENEKKETIKKIKETVNEVFDRLSNRSKFPDAKELQASLKPQIEKLLVQITDRTPIVLISSSFLD